ncbi:hypothetical protein [Actinoplanes sp. G11-F43]|uniref:hypothetical protein n=1 Tax=Actinoplanes sp. G11-F43 TaxID=3424130 RepID=UPI003D357DCB
MTENGPTGWRAYSELGELITELDLADEDMVRAREATDDHVRAWHLAKVHFGDHGSGSRQLPGPEVNGRGSRLTDR